MFTKTFWKDAAERALATVAEVLIALWVVAGDQAFDLFTVDPLHALGVALGAAVLSVLKSIVVAKGSTDSTASPVKEVGYKA